jgi:gliding motility-associated-like protein
MKKILLIVSFLLTSSIYSQAVSVSNATAQQMINGIINSNCITPSTTIAPILKSGADYAGNPLSAGKFSTPTISDFPFASGIVLSTGGLAKVPGPKTLPFYIGDGSPTWLGDTDMNTFLGASNFSNASSLQFNFKSLKNQISFDYVFVSEEYGNNQCKPESDMVLILLTDLTTGVTKNIATIPSTPPFISPNNIRLAVNNGACADANPGFYGETYNSTNAATAPINFKGTTIPITASSSLVIGREYKIKFVIADRIDSQYDSAIFIGNYEKNISTGTFLGPNRSVCEGESITLPTGITATFEWQRDTSLESQTGSTFTIPASQAFGTHTYKASYFTSNCGNYDGETDEITITFLEPLQIPEPVKLYRCSMSSAYSLSVNTTIMSDVVGYTPVITYHTDALCVTPALPLNYSGNATTLYVKITKPGNPCPVYKQFDLGTLPDPTGVAPPPIKICPRTSTTTAGPYNLRDLDATILNGQSPTFYEVSYHLSPIAANNNTGIINILANGNALIPGGTTTLYARVFIKGNQNCFYTVSFGVVVDTRLPADNPDPVAYCGNTYILPPLTNGHYYPKKFTEPDPTFISQGIEIPALSAVSPLSTTATETVILYVSNQYSSTQNCTDEFPFKITFIRPDYFTETTRTECNIWSLPKLDYGNYVITKPDGTVINTSDAYDLKSPIGVPVSTYLVGYHFESIGTTLNPSCVVNVAPVSITIENSPDLGPDRENIFTCNPPYFLPALTNPLAKYYDGPHVTGQPLPNEIALSTPLNASKDIYVYAEATSPITCPSEDYFRIEVGLTFPNPPITCTYQLPVPVVGKYYARSHSDPLGPGPEILPGYDVPSPGTYWLYVAPIPSDPTTCAFPYVREVSFFVNVTHPPADDIAGFESPHCGVFLLPPLVNGKYYTKSHFNGENGGTQLFANSPVPVGTPTNPTTTIYVYAAPRPPLLTCAFEKVFIFTNNPIPLVDTLLDHDECDNDFYQLAPLTNGNYYTAPHNPNGTGGGQLLDTQALRLIQGPVNKRIYIYNRDATTNCYDESFFDIKFGKVLIDPIANPIIESCTNFTLSTLTNGKYYEDTGGFQGTIPLPGTGNGVEITNLTRTIPITTTLPFYDDTIYIYNATLDGSRIICPKESNFRLILYKKPVINPISDIYVCKNTDVKLIDLPSISGTNIFSPISMPAKYYTGSHLNGGTGGLEVDANTVLTNNQTIYAYAKNASIIPGSTFAGCESEVSFKLNIFKVDKINDISGCGSIALSDLPTLTTGGYYSSANGVNPVIASDLINTGTTILTKKLYIHGTSGFPAAQCQTDQTDFNVTINPIPVANPVTSIIDRTFCDTDSDNDGQFSVNLSVFSSTILGATQTGSEFSVTYHATSNDALLNQNSITSINDSKVFAIVHNSNFGSCTSLPLEINFIIKKLPEPKPEDKIICVDNVTNLPDTGVFVTLDANLPTGHTFEWFDKNGIIVAATNNTYTTNVPGVYSVVATSTDPINPCSSLRADVNVIPSSIAITGYSVTQNFEDNQTIIVIASGANDDFEYSLDGAPYVTSNVFENLLDGNHTIIVRDINGCGQSPPINALIINYPKYFTPNGDSFNDTWNIKGLDKNQIGAKISIYDRHGKLLKQISPSSNIGNGWDGTYNGAQMPSSDYWFTVRYLEDGLEKEFKSHFAMKR